ncbi:MAG: hypothetical protein VCA36_13290 [Opitutales bacterium]
MELLQPPDSIYLEAAQGWMELGNHEEALEELGLIDAPPRSLLNSFGCRLALDIADIPIGVK